MKQIQSFEWPNFAQSKYVAKKWKIQLSPCVTLDISKR